MSGTLTGIVAILIGLVVCFLGYRLFRILLPLAGLVFGYALGVRLVPPDQWRLALLIGVAAAVLFALLAWQLWSAAVIIGGAVLGFSFGWSLAGAYLAPGRLPLVIAVAAAVLFAVLAALLRKLALMLSTAAGGAGAVAYGLGLLVPSLSLGKRPNVPATVLIVGLALAGFFVQFSMYRDRNRYDEDGPEAGS